MLRPKHDAPLPSPFCAWVRHLLHGDLLAECIDKAVLQFTQTHGWLRTRCCLRAREQRSKTHQNLCLSQKGHPMKTVCEVAPPFAASQSVCVCGERGLGGMLLSFWLLAAALVLSSPRQPLACAAFKGCVAGYVPQAIIPSRWRMHLAGRAGFTHSRGCCNQLAGFISLATVVCPRLLGFKQAFCRCILPQGMGPGLLMKCVHLCLSERLCSLRLTILS